MATPRDEDLLNQVRQAMMSRGRRAEYDAEPNMRPLHAGAVYDYPPEELGEDEEPYPGVTPEPPRPSNARDKYETDAFRVRGNRAQDPYEDRGIFNFPLDNIRDVLRWGKDDEIGAEALDQLGNWGAGFGDRALQQMEKLKGLNPEMDDFAFIQSMRKRLGMSKPDPLYDHIRDDEEFRRNNPGRGGMFRLDQPTRDPLSDAYPQRGGSPRSRRPYMNEYEE